VTLDCVNLGCVPLSGLEGLETQPVGGREVLDVGGDERGLVLDGGRADERIG
jgi:hypothetical protein